MTKFQFYCVMFMLSAIAVNTAPTFWHAIGGVIFLATSLAMAASTKPTHVEGKP